MALWIKAKRETANGFIVETVLPQRGTAFTFTELRRFVSGANVEHIRLNDGHVMWLNRDRDKLQLPLNNLANNIAHEETGIPLTENINGDVLLATAVESGEESK